MTEVRPTVGPVETMAEIKARRGPGVRARNAAKLERRRKIGCRVWDHETGLCGNECVDPDAPIRLCNRHLALAYEMLRERLHEYLTEVTP